MSITQAMMLAGVYAAQPRVQGCVPALGRPSSLALHRFGARSSFGTARLKYLRTHAAKDGAAKDFGPEEKNPEIIDAVEQPVEERNSSSEAPEPSVDPDIAAAVRKLTADAAAARLAAEEAARNLIGALERAETAASERDCLTEELAREKARATALAEALEQKTREAKRIAEKEEDSLKSTKKEEVPGKNGLISATESPADTARIQDLERELEELHAVQAQRDAMVQEWAQEAAISCQLATSAAEAHAAVVAELDASQAALRDARLQLEEERKNEAVASNVQELETLLSSERSARTEADSALATALEHLSETEEEVDAQAALITSLREEAAAAARDAERLQRSMAKELEESGELLAHAEERLVELGRRAKEAEMKLQQEGGGVKDSKAPANVKQHHLDDELRVLRDEVSFLQIELEAEMTFCEQAAERAAAAEEEVSRLRARHEDGAGPGAVGTRDREAEELTALVETQARALTQARADAARASSEADRVRTKLEALERAQKSRSSHHPLLFGAWGRGNIIHW